VAFRDLFPRRFRRSISTVFAIIEIIYSYACDLIEYLKFSSTIMPSEKDCQMLESRIIAHYHMVEKGLSLKDPRFEFGRKSIKQLLTLLQTYKEKCINATPFIYNCAISSILGYIRFHEYHGINVFDIRNDIEELKGREKAGGTIRLRREDVFADSRQEFSTFCRSRHSIRNFTEERGSTDRIIEAVEMAQSAPSVWNRQTSRVYVVVSRDLVNDVLNLQGGSRGFKESVDKVLVITSSLHGFCGIHERNQSFIDGGIYLMNLLYGLHYAQIGACPLMACRSRKSVKQLRRRLGIPESERLIALIGIGNVPEIFQVAESRRFPVEKVCTVIKES
jgi:hypothetical protein